MWELIIYLSFGEPGEHERDANVSVGVYQSIEMCDRARWDWFSNDRLPAGFAPHYAVDDAKKGWFHALPGRCQPVNLTS